jgi:hypothetical protein
MIPSSQWPSTSRGERSVGCRGLSVMSPGMRSTGCGTTISSWLRRWATRRVGAHAARPRRARPVLPQGKSHAGWSTRQCAQTRGGPPIGARRGWRLAGCGGSRGAGGKTAPAPGRNCGPYGTWADPCGRRQLRRSAREVPGCSSAITGCIWPTASDERRKAQ